MLSPWGDHCPAGLTRWTALSSTRLQGVALYASARATCLLLAPAEAGATAACRCSFVLIWQRTCLLAPRHLSHVLVLQTPVSVKSITDYHNFVPPDKAICIGNIQSKVGYSALPELCELLLPTMLLPMMQPCSLRG